MTKLKEYCEEIYTIKLWNTTLKDLTSNKISHNTFKSKGCKLFKQKKMPIFISDKGGGTIYNQT